MAATFYLPLRGILCHFDFVPSCFTAIKTGALNSSSHRYRFLGAELSLPSERIFKLLENSGKVQPQSCSCTKRMENPVCLHNHGNSHNRVLRTIPEYERQEMTSILASLVRSTPLQGAQTFDQWYKPVIVYVSLYSTPQQSSIERIVFGQGAPQYRRQL